MNKAEFIRQLKQGLNGYEPQDVEEIIADYEDHFRAAQEKGKSEDEICVSLGYPQSIAKAYKVENLLNKAKSDKNPSDFLRAFIVFISLGLFNLLFVLNPVLGLILVLFGLWLIPFVSVGVGAIGIIAPFFAPFIDYQIVEVTNVSFIHYIGLFLVGVGTLALGILLSILLWRLTKIFFKILVKYIEANITLIKNKK